MKKILLIAIAILALVACEDKGGVNEVNESDGLKQFKLRTLDGVYSKGANSLVYNTTIHQLAVNPTKLSYRIQNDLQSIYCHCELASKPSEIGGKTTIKVTSKDVPEVFSKTYEVTLVKIDGMKMWLWDEANNIGFVMTI